MHLRNCRPLRFRFWDAVQLVAREQNVDRSLWKLDEGSRILKCGRAEVRSWLPERLDSESHLPGRRVS